MFYNATLRRNVRSSARRKASPDAIADELANKRVSDEADGPGDEIRSGLDALAEATQKYRRDARYYRHQYEPLGKICD
jgi:hypothetical protein